MSGYGQQGGAIVPDGIWNVFSPEAVQALIDRLPLSQGLIWVPPSYSGAEFTSLPNDKLLVDLRQRIDALTDATTNIRRRPTMLVQHRLGALTYRTLTGSCTFTNGNVNVTGSGTLFSTEVSAGDTIRLVTNTEASYAKVASVTNNTALVLSAVYPGAGGTGVGVNGQADLGVVIKNYATAGTPNTSGAGESVGLTIISDRAAGNRAMFGANFNTSFHNKLNGGATLELDLNVFDSADWAEAGETNNGEVTQAYALRINTAGTKKAQGAIIIDKLSTTVNFQRGISMDQSWYAKGIYSRAADAAGVHLYMVPQANNSGGAILFRNAADAATVANVLNDGTAQFTNLYPLANNGPLGSTALRFAGVFQTAKVVAAANDAANAIYVNNTADAATVAVIANNGTAQFTYLYPMAAGGACGSTGLPFAGVFSALQMQAGRLQLAKGANVATANTLTLGTDGNFFQLTGTTTINGITTSGWQTGSILTLWFTGTVTVTNASGAPGGGAVALKLNGAANMSAVTGNTLTLVYDGTNWR